MPLTLSHAKIILSAALSRARAIDCKPLAVVVLDPGAHPIAFAREDGASLFRLDIAKAKATGALGMGDDSSVIAERAKNLPIFYQSISNVVGGNIAYSPGGVLIRDHAGSVLGAVGISGDTGERDEDCAQAGIAAAGY